MTDLSKLYYINLGKNGTFGASNNPLFDTTAKDVDKIIADLRKNDQSKILLYFHGGLVNDQEGMKTAERVYRYTQDSGTHPITFVWETGMIGTIRDNLRTINSSSFFNKLLVKIIKVVGKELGINLDDSGSGSKGIGNMSDAQIALQLMQERPFEEVSMNIGKKSVLIDLEKGVISDIYLDTTVHDELSLQYEEEIGEDRELLALASAPKSEAEARLLSIDKISVDEMDGQKGIISAAYLIKCAIRITLKILKRHVKKRAHGFYPTIVEEILREFYVADVGEWVWSGMKQKAKDMWTQDTANTPDEKKHGGAYLLSQLKAYQEERKESLTIDLVGHSAGSIAICHLMNSVNIQQMGFHFRNIIFMAPACSTPLFYKSIMSNQHLFDHFRIFTMLEEREVEDVLMPVIYPRSLLYFVSGLLEKDEYDATILGLQRHHSNRAPYDTMDELPAIAEYLKDGDKVVYSQSAKDALPGFRSGALKHGDFDNEAEITLDSIISIIKN